MRILWFTWKDRKHPLSGGAELVNEELARRLIQIGYEITFIVAGFRGGVKEEIINGYKIIRLGNRWTVYWHAYRYYKKYLYARFDFVIDEINTIPFFTTLFVKEKIFVFIHQLAREIWFYEMLFPLNMIGWLFELLYLKLYRKYSTITISESTKKDLEQLGFKNVSIISEGIDVKPCENLTPIGTKEETTTILFLGSLRRMKRPHHAVIAFKEISKKIPNIQLWLAGRIDNRRYFKRIVAYIKKNKLEKKVKIFGSVSKKDKCQLLEKAHVLVVTSVREGWCLVVTEANALGTPSVVYNVSGLRDAVKDNETGLVCKKNNTIELANNIIKLLQNSNLYNRLRNNAWQWSKEINFEKSVRDFLNILHKEG